MQLSVPDAKAKLDDARWHIDQAIGDLIRRHPEETGVIANIACVRKQIADLIEGAPFKRSYAESEAAPSLK